MMKETSHLKKLCKKLFTLLKGNTNLKQATNLLSQFNNSQWTTIRERMTNSGLRMNLKSQRREAERATKIRAANLSERQQKLNMRIIRKYSSSSQPHQRRTLSRNYQIMALPRLPSKLRKNLATGLVL